MKTRQLPLSCFVLLLVAPSPIKADTFGSGANTFEIPFVAIGSPGNPADTTGDPNPAGGVSYAFRIGKYEVPEDAVRKANAISAAQGSPLDITLDSRGPDKPATSLSWFEAAKFVNFLNASTGATPAYKFDSAGNFQLWTPTDPGYNPGNLFRNSLAHYFLPSTDEWYKAAFYDPTTAGYWDYATGSNSAPVAVASGTALGTAVWEQSFAQGPADVALSGGPSPFGTKGQSGNVNEWLESLANIPIQSNPLTHGVRGGDWIGPSINSLSLSSSFAGIGSPATANPINVGFRVASVPEPKSIAIAVTCCLSLCTIRVSSRKQHSIDSGVFELLSQESINAKAVS